MSKSMHEAAVGREVAIVLENRLDHDHAHLAALLSDLTRLVDQLVAVDTSQTGTLMEEIRDVVALLKEDTYEHFEREEHGLFPNLELQFPEHHEKLGALQAAHDGICSGLEQVERLVGGDEPKNRDLHEIDSSRKHQLRDAAAHLAELYSTHTADEWSFLKSLLGRLDETMRQVIMRELGEV